MDLDLDQLAAAVLRLPAAQRAALATRLLASLDADGAEAETPDSVAAAWAAELDRRDAELDADPSLGVPAADVFARADAELRAVAARQVGAAR